MNQQLVGCLWGTALGDALGLCREGLSARRGQRLYPNLDRFQLFAGRGLVSDDTEHAAFTAWALAGNPHPAAFQRRLRRAFRRWLWCLPAGIGFATLRAGIKSSLGFANSGIYSAGNGPLMRTPVLAVAGPEDLEPYLHISTCMTHTDHIAHCRQCAMWPRSPATCWAAHPGNPYRASPKTPIRLPKNLPNPRAGKTGSAASWNTPPR